MKYLVAFFIAVLLFLQTTGSILAGNTIWEIQAIDTMKYSRDEARKADVRDQIDHLIEIIADTGATHVSIATPYNEEFVPTLTAWVQSARRHNLKVWFRGNWAEWEGWFGYQKFTDVTEHHRKTAAFIPAHPELFADGDIFTPAPEAENGGMGDPRGSEPRSRQFNEFLVTSAKTCTQAFKKMGKFVQCGYFSMNGDIAKQVLTPETVKQAGNVVVIDHYVKDPVQFEKDIIFLSEKFKAPIILGEYGAPIPDLNGTMTETQQAEYVKKLMEVMYKEKARVSGMNYWTLISSSTALLNDNGTPRDTVDVLTSYFTPLKVEGRVIDVFGDAVPGVSVSVPNTPAEIKTDGNGTYTLLLPQRDATIEMTKEGYHPFSSSITGVGVESGKTVSLDAKLNPKERGLLYYLKMIPVWIKEKVTST